MAQRVLGIDLGAHSVKVAEVEVGFRSMRLARLRTLGVPQGPQPALERSLEALKSLREMPPGVDMVSVGVPGDGVLTRLFDVPFTDPKKVAAVVANELADDIPWEMEEVVFDHAPLVGVPGRVLAVAARSADLRELLETLESMDIDPRNLPPSTLSYGRVVRRLEPDGAVLLVDLGHARTNLCLLLDGRPLVARTISRGGHQITEAFRQSFQLSYAEAEQFKERQGFLHVGDPAGLDDRGRHISGLCAEALAPLVREARLSIGLVDHRLGRRPDRVLLCGGTSLLRGIDSFLGEALELPCSRLDLSSAEDLDTAQLSDEGQAVGALSMGLCLEQGGRRGLDLRQGDFAYTTDTSLFREKLVTVAVSVVLVLVFVALNAFMSLFALRKEEKLLKAQLKRASQSVFGEPLTNPRKVSSRVKRGSRATASGIPDRSAFDILNMISRMVPGRKKLKLDIARMDIKPGKTFIKGTADSRTQIGGMVKALEAVDCFTNVTSGKISEVAQEKKQFTLTIDTDCF